MILRRNVRKVGFFQHLLQGFNGHALRRRSGASLDLAAVDLLIVENVGNLVCPAEFDIGENFKAVVLSITEGDDKPLKYPLIFKESAITLLNKKLSP